MILSYSFAKHNQVVLSNDDKHLTLYFVKNLNPLILQEIKRVSIKEFLIKKVLENDFNKILEQAYQAENTDTNEAIEFISEELNLDDFKGEFAKSEDLLESSDNSPIIKLINALLVKAIQEKASDIHIESFEHRIAIRIRIDGVLQTVMNPPVELSPFIISRVKIMSGLDIAEKRLPQDGRISTQIAGRNIDIRVSTLPVANSERIVMRILDRDTSGFSISSLAIPSKIEEKIKKLIKLPYGIFLVVGPTGSGKTTTLYSSLSELDIEHKNIMTIEDPIEYFLDGISQTQINTKSGMDFSKGLRAILRQDPDIVMIGEIRDFETAQMAVQASLTGHTVFSTLHTNTAVGAIIRLVDMGIEPFLIGSSLTGVLSQRLVRKLCNHCKIPVSSSNFSQKIIGNNNHYKATGCNQCSELGYKGRVAVYELVEIDDNIKNFICDGSSELKIAEYAKTKNDSLVDSAASLVIEGTTSLEEIIRVI